MCERLLSGNEWDAGNVEGGKGVILKGLTGFLKGLG